MDWQFFARCITIALITALNAAAAAEGAEPDAEPVSRWYFYWGASNLHSELKSSEAKIDRELNGTLGQIIPGWKRPVTLRDWSKDFLLWDLHVGVGRNLSPRWSWFVGTGGTAGILENDETYPLLLPLRVGADFTRRLSFLVTGFDFYPWGKPVFHHRPGRSWLAESLRAARPYLEFSTSYTRLKTIADVKVSVPGVLTLLKKYDECDYDLFHLSPRVGIETPLTKKDSIAVHAGYLLCNQNPAEFNNFSIYILHKHRF